MRAVEARIANGPISIELARSQSQDHWCFHPGHVLEARRSSQDYRWVILSAFMFDRREPNL